MPVRSHNDIARLRGPNAAKAQALRSAAYAGMARDIAVARRRRSQRVWGIALLIAAGTVAGVFQSCAGSKASRAKEPDQPLLFSSKKKPPRAAKSSAEADAAEAPGKSSFDQAATDLQAMFDAMGDEPAAEPAAAPPPLQPDASSSPARPVRSEPSLNAPTSRPGHIDADHPAATPPATHSEHASTPPPRHSHSGAAADEPAGPPAPPTTPLAEPASAPAASAPADPEMLALGTVALCTRVESFGRYQPFAGDRFLAGRRNAAIVYAEVDHFAQLAAGELDLTSLPDTGKLEADSLLVELSISVELFHDSDGSRQWRSGESVIRDHSRTRRRDFYLVQRIDLPPNLSVGKYNLKVTVRDRLAPGPERPETEAVIPIQIVADPGLLGADAALVVNPGSRLVRNAPVAGPEPAGK